MKRNRGITLIALVITIIVLLILAGVSISLVMDDNGILKQAQRSVKDHSEAEVIEQIKLACSAYEMAKAGGVTESAKDYIERELKDVLKDNDLIVSISEETGEVIVSTNVKGEKNEYKYNPQTGLYSQNSKWKDNGDCTYTHNETGVTVKFGDYINYDEGTDYFYTTNPADCASNEWPEWSSANYNATKNGYVFSAGTFTTENLNWRVLGVSDNGNLELISEYPTSAQLYLGGKIGYDKSEKILNELCNTLYGNGKFADSARSLRNEDIYKLRGITEMNSTLYNGYGTKYQFKYENSDTALMYRTSAPSTENWTAWSSTSYDGFYTPKDGLVVGVNKRGISDIIVCDYVTPYFWNGNDLIDQIIYCDQVSNSNTWLASKGIWQEGNRVSFPVSSSHGNRTLYASNNEYSCMEAWIRPVATLKLSATIDTSSTTGETVNSAYILK